MKMPEETGKMIKVVLDALSEYVLFVDPQMHIQWANRVATESAGMDPLYLKGRHCFEIWHNRKEICPKCPIARVFETGQPQEGEITSPEKRYWFIRGYPVRDEKGEIFGAAEIAVDITGRKRVEEALRESEERYRSVIQTCPDGITLSNLDGKLITANEQTARLYGCDTVEELLSSGKSAFDFIVPEDRQRAIENAKKTLEEGLIQNVEYTLLRKDGSTYPVELSASTILDAEGRPRAFVGVVRDITKRKQVEQEKKRLQEQIQHAQKLESLGILAGGIAHDFNNLIMGVLGNASLALLDLPEVSPVRHSLEQIDKTARAAADLTNQMLAYSGKGRFVVKEVDLSRLVEEMAGLLKVSISKKVDLKFDFDRDLPPVEADATQLCQVTMNLITNASEAVGEKAGVVLVRTGTMEADSSFFAETHTHDDLPEGTYVYMEVSDTGCGMDPETVGKIFDPFFTSKFTGRGLGMAAALGIVRGHKGAIRVQSEPGHGTTIRVVFPACKAEKHSPAPEPNSEKPRPASGKILVVDDEATIRDVSRRMLQSSGFDVITTGNGREAIEIFRLQGDEIAAVLLDATMPQMDGLETFEELRRIRQDVRVVLSSGYSEREATERFTGKGLTGFIQKPYRFDGLADKMQEILGK